MIFNKKDTLNAENGNLLQYFPADHSGFVPLFIPFYDK